jgi:signal transduction histidine kinase/ligand-binding sensor domain-containing protein
MLCSSAFALDPNQPLRQLYHSRWNAINGLKGSVNALAQTPDGYLWVGSSDGLFRFDGLYFERYQPEVGSWPANAVSALMALPTGELWVGFDSGGVSVLKDGHITSYDERDGFPVSRVRFLAQDREGTIWAAVVGGFTRFEGGRWIKIRMDWNYPSRAAGALYVDREGTFWVAHGHGFMYLKKGERWFHDAGPRTGNVFALTQSPDGTFLFHDADLPGLRSFRYPPDNPKETGWNIAIPTRAVLFDRQGALWLGGIGLTRIPFPDRLKGQRVTETTPGVERFTETDDLSDNTVNAVLEDREGNIWVGTDAGLERFRYRNLTWFPLPDETMYFSLVAGDRGEMWTGSRGDREFPVMRVPEGIPVSGGPVGAYTTYRDPHGAIWIGARDRLVRWGGGVFTDIPPPKEAVELAGSSATKDPITVSSITQDRSGTMWVSIGGSGEFQLRDGVWTFIEILKDHPDYAANSAITDGADRVWLSYGNRVAVFDHGVVRTFAAPEGLTAGPTNALANRGEQVWAGCESGLAFLRGDRFQVLTGADGNLFDSVTGIVAPANDGIWLSAAPGIVHIPEGEVQRATKDPTYRVNYEVFDLVSDLPEQLQRGGVYSSGAIEGTDGLLWFATQGGVARIDRSVVYRNPVPPPVSIRSVVADEKSYSVFARAALPALTKNLRIDYTALSLSIPERVRFRYRLEGWDTHWQEAGNRRQAFYTNLAPGKYTFRVIACNNDGVWNESGASLEFIVAPAWYQTAWFRIACVLAGLGVLWLLFRLRVRQVAQGINARFDERLAERTRLARELHDTFLQTVQGSKMVAEDALDGPADPARMRSAMEQLSVWLTQATDEGRAALNSLRTSTIEQNDLAEGFRRATEEGLIPQSMTATFSLAGESRSMHPIVRDEIYRIGYEAIRNACAHSGATRLEVELIYTHDLFLRVKDNGTGIDAAIREKGKEGHFGLQGMRERAARIGSKLVVGNPPEGGTEVTLSVPGHMIFRKPEPTVAKKLKQFFARRK